MFHRNDVSSPFFFSFANEGKTKEGKQILTKSQVKD
jgi:hypothetical protein